MLTKLTLALVLLTACGKKSDSGNGSNEDQAPPGVESQSTAQDPKRALAINDASQLPACTPEGEYWLVYVKAEKVFKTCTAGSWENIDLQASIGETGETAKGPAKVIVDAANKVIGTLINEQDMTFRITDTELVGRLHSLESGFSKVGDYGRCYFRTADCSDECIMLSSAKPGYISPTKLYIPGIKPAKTISGLSPSQLLGQHDDSFSCVTFDTATTVKSDKFPMMLPTEFTLPFRFLAD